MSEVFDQIQEIRKEVVDCTVYWSVALEKIECCLKGHLRPKDIEWIEQLRRGFPQAANSNEISGKLLYRLYEGNWSTGIAPTFKTDNNNPYVRDIKPFCAMPITEMESQIEKYGGAGLLISGLKAIGDAVSSDSLKSNLLEITSEPQSGLKFLIFPNELLRIYAETRLKICLFIDDLVIDLDLRPKGL